MIPRDEAVKSMLMTVLFVPSPKYIWEMIKTHMKHNPGVSLSHLSFTLNVRYAVANYRVWHPIRLPVLAQFTAG